MPMQGCIRFQKTWDIHDFLWGVQEVVEMGWKKSLILHFLVGFKPEDILINENWRWGREEVSCKTLQNKAAEYRITKR